MGDIETFNKNGFVLIKNFFTEEESEQIVNFANTLETWNETANKWMIFFEKEKKKSRIEQFIDYYPELNEFMKTKVYPKVNSINGSDMNIFKDKLNWKHGGGNGFNAHQDHPAWTDFEPNIYISVALFANNSTKQNGCLQFGKGETKFVKECDYNKEGMGEIKKQIEDKLEWDFSETTPRDLLLFDSFVPHRSFKNTTDHSRRIFYFTFNDKKYGNLYNDYFITKRNNFPPDIERTTKVKLNNNKYNLANPIL
tara:strand:+ start:1278 stop:2036 length:759 start_codon:yes stop_codon:yes gene_type:complete